MSTVAYSGRGSKLNIQTGVSPTAYTAIAQLRKFAMSGLKVTTDDITNIDSPSAFKEIMPTVIDPGDVSFDGILNSVAASQGDLLSLCQNQTLTNFQIVLSDGVTTIAFSGYVTDYVPVVVEATKANTFSGKLPSPAL